MKLISENGRSMVEMLGVLAIIGVLSIAGVQGYSYAMAKHRANDAAHQASLAYAEIIAAATQGNQGNMSLTLPANSIVSLEDARGYQNSRLKVDFGDDTAACKQFAAMYEGNADFAVSVNCDD